jgi:hypothetical protein
VVPALVLTSYSYSYIQRQCIEPSAILYSPRVKIPILPCERALPSSAYSSIRSIISHSTLSACEPSAIQFAILQPYLNQTPYITTLLHFHHTYIAIHQRISPYHHITTHIGCNPPKIIPYIILFHQFIYRTRSNLFRTRSRLSGTLHVASLISKKSQLARTSQDHPGPSRQENSRRSQTTQTFLAFII